MRQRFAPIAGLMKPAIEFTSRRLIAAQAFLAFGSAALYDASFNIAHGLKIVAYGVPLVGLVDTLGRAFLPDVIFFLFASEGANSIAASIASMGIYLLMATILAFKPRGLFPA